MNLICLPRYKKGLMRVFVSFAFILLFGSSLVFAMDKGAAKALFNQANTAYENENYQEASDIFEQLLNEEFRSAELYHNLGLCYSYQNKLAQAILQLERALKIKPSNKKIRQNLKLLNENVNAEISPLPEFFLKTWYYFVIITLPVWVWVSIHLLFLFSFVFVLYQYLIRKNTFGYHRSYINGLMIGLVFISLLCLVFAYSRNKNMVRSDSAIILESSVPLRAGAEGNSQIEQELPSGIKVRIEDQINEYLKIKLADGNEGWINEKFAERI